MKEFLRALFVIALVAFVVVGVSGCRKEKKIEIPVIEKDEDKLAAPPGDAVYTADNPEIYKPIYFDFDKSDIKPEAKPVLEAIAMDLKANPKKFLLIEGHCDERGTNEYNLALSERRAQGTLEYLAVLGVNRDNITTKPLGEEMPADPEHNEAAWAKNRRSEFKTWTAEKSDK